MGDGSDEPIYSAMAVLQCGSAKPVGASGAATPLVSSPRVMTSWQTALWTYHWLLWVFLIGLLLAQLSCALWDSSTRYESTIIGQPPSASLQDLQAEGFDPEPYADRLLVCTLNGGRQYQPMQLSVALARSGPTSAEAASSVNAYRVVRRSPEKTVPAETLERFSSVCDLVAWTLDAITDSCSTLGYTPVTDYARVVDGVASTAAIKGVTDSLPLLIEPLDDESVLARYLMPGVDGAACVFRLLGKYETPTATPSLILRGVNRSVHESKTLELLQHDASLTGSGGSWKNGWYEASDGTKWHSEVISTTPTAALDTYGVVSRIFDTETNRDLPPNTTTDWPVELTWGTVASAADTLLWFQSLTLSDGAGRGVFRYESSEIRVLRSAFSLETLITTASMLWVLLRWAVCMVALQRSFRRGCLVQWHAAGLGGSVACMRSFHLLSIVMLVRLKKTLAAFWIVGCIFDGDQRAASEAWFVVYPAIAELVLFQLSLINIVAKLLRHRVSDVLWGPTVVTLCLLHLVRNFTFPEPLTSLVLSSEMVSLSLPDFVSSSVALRINGNIAWLFYLKLAVLAVNWVPLVVGGERNAVICKRSLAHAGCRVEKAMALRVSNLGGFGLSPVYLTASPGKKSETQSGDAAETTKKKPDHAATSVAAFELLRMGYLAIGGRYVMLINDWFLMLLLTPWRRRVFPPNFRFIVFTVERDAHTATIGVHPELMRLNDPRLLAVELLDVSTAPMV